MAIVNYLITRVPRDTLILLSLFFDLSAKHNLQRKSNTFS